MKSKINRLKSILICTAALLCCACGNAAEKGSAAVNKGNFIEAKQEENSDPLPAGRDTVVPVAEWPAVNSLRYLSGKFKADEHPDITLVPKVLTDGDGSYYMHRDALAAFEKMHAAAAAEGIQLTIVSAFRNFARQKAIWEAKWNGQRLLEGKEKANEVYPDPAERALAILRYSSMPGSSRHHWGTDIDLNRLNNEYFGSGVGKATYDWLVANAAEFGFCQPYTAIGPERPHGYQEEKWHWSYQPLAGKLTDLARDHLTYGAITGFDGAESGERIEVIRKYVLGVNKSCL